LFARRLVAGLGLVLRGARVRLAFNDIPWGIIECFERFEGAVDERLGLVRVGGDAVAEVLAHKKVCLGDGCRRGRTRWRRGSGHVGKLRWWDALRNVAGMHGIPVVSENSCVLLDLI